jgi:hypothetical protein
MKSTETILSGSLLPVAGVIYPVTIKLLKFEI